MDKRVGFKKLYAVYFEGKPVGVYASRVNAREHKAELGGLSKGATIVIMTPSKEIR